MKLFEIIRKRHEQTLKNIKEKEKINQNHETFCGMADRPAGQIDYIVVNRW